MDMLFVVLAHILIGILVAIIVWWQNNHAPEPPIKRIEVTMISAQALKKMLHAPKKKAAPVKKKLHKVKVTPKAKPLVNIKPKPKLKPVPKLVEKPQPKPKPATTKTKVRDEPDFDPFAPMVSSTDSKKKRAKPKADIADLMGKQLSSQEINRYIAMMQAAVQAKWKVPGGISENTPDPLVEVILQPNGSIVRVSIVESSGDSTLDQTLVTAIRAAAPFQVPREQFESFRKNRIRFHPLK
jgi:TonB family protein